MTATPLSWSSYAGYGQTEMRHIMPQAVYNPWSPAKREYEPEKLPYEDFMARPFGLDWFNRYSTKLTAAELNQVSVAEEVLRFVQFVQQEMHRTKGVQECVTPKTEQRPPSASRPNPTTTAVQAQEVLRLQQPGVTAAFSPDGRYILSGGRSILLWAVDTGKLIREMAVQETVITSSLAFSPNGRLALSGGSEGVRVFDVSSGQEIRRLGGAGWFRKAVGVRAVAFDPEGRFALAGGNDPYLRMWDVASGKLLRTFEEGIVNTGLAGFGQPGMDFQMATVLKGVAFSPDGRHAVSAGDALGRASGRYLAVLWDVQSGKRLRLFEGHEGVINGIVFSADGRHVLTGSDDRTVRLWDTASGKELRRFEGHPAPVHAAAFSPDGRLAVSGNGLFGGKAPEQQQPPESVIRVWRVETGEEVCQLVGHTGQVRSVCFSPDGKFVLSAGSDNTVRLWKLPPLQGQK